MFGRLTTLSYFYVVPTSLACLDWVHGHCAGTIVIHNLTEKVRCFGLGSVRTCLGIRATGRPGGHWAGCVSGPFLLDARFMPGRLGLVHREGVDGRQQLHRGNKFWSGHVKQCKFF